VALIGVSNPNSRINSALTGGSAPGPKAATIIGLRL
jgi:hypothetical protein